MLDNRRRIWLFIECFLSCPLCASEIRQSLVINHSALQTKYIYNIYIYIIYIIYIVYIIYIYIYIYIYNIYSIYIYIALWCKNQIEHSIWDESLLLSNCACSLEYSSLSTLAGLSYHICGKLEVAFKASPSSQHQHCTDEAQKAETVLSAVIYIYIYILTRVL